MDLFIIKTDAGYIKYNSAEDLKLVEIEKASVFPQTKLPFLKELMAAIREKGLSNPRIAKLSLEETDFFIAVGDL